MQGASGLKVEAACRLGRLTSQTNDVDYKMAQNNEYGTAVYVLALCHLAGVQPRLFEVLIHLFGSPERILKADRNSLKAINGMTAEMAKRITDTAALLKQADELHRQLKERDIAVITRFDSGFPQLLFELNDPPPLLYIRGRIPDNNKKTVTLAGAENATNEGIELTVKLASAFAGAGVQVIASLSRGINASAHVGTRAADGVSYCVLDSGFDQIHPSEHIPLAIDVAQSGGVISEYPPEQTYTTESFKTSNRLLAGLAQAVVITELYHDSTRTLDLLSFCRQIGKLAFIMIDPERGALADEGSLAEAVSCGAIPLAGLGKIGDIIKALV
jgi:DNA processing protein